MPRENGLVARKTGCPLSLNLIIINSGTLSHFPPGLSLSVEYHFVFDPGPRNDQRPAGNLFSNRDTSVELAIHSVSLSLFRHMIDVTEHRHEDNSSLEVFGFAHFFHELLEFVDKLQCAVNPGKYSTRIPSVLRRLCPKFCIVMNL